MTPFWSKIAFLQYDSTADHKKNVSNSHNSINLTHDLRMKPMLLLQSIFAGEEEERKLHFGSA